MIRHRTYTTRATLTVAPLLLAGCWEFMAPPPVHNGGLMASAAPVPNQTALGLSLSPWPDSSLVARRSLSLPEHPALAIDLGGSLGLNMNDLQGLATLDAGLWLRSRPEANRRLSRGLRLGVQFMAGDADGHLPGFAFSSQGVSLAGQLSHATRRIPGRRTLTLDLQGSWPTIDFGWGSTTLWLEQVTGLDPQDEDDAEELEEAVLCVTGVAVLHYRRDWGRDQGVRPYTGLSFGGYAFTEYGDANGDGQTPSDAMVYGSAALGLRF